MIGNPSISAAHKAAQGAIKTFRSRELNPVNLRTYEKRFGQLIDPTSEVPPDIALVAQSTKLKKEPRTLPNPFIPRLNQKTGRWCPPKYSLRQQADLIKKAKLTNTLHLLPPGPKLPLRTIELAAKAISNPKPNKSNPSPAWQAPVGWEGKVVEKEVPGADIGSRLYASKKRMFKGHKWERVFAQKKNHRRMLMRDMDKRIRQYTQYYKVRRPKPLKPKKSSQNVPIPF